MVWERPPGLAVCFSGGSIPLTEQPERLPNERRAERTNEQNERTMKANDLRRCIEKMIAHHSAEAELSARYARVFQREYLANLCLPSEPNTPYNLRLTWQAYRDYTRLMFEHLGAVEYWNNKLN